MAKMKDFDSLDELTDVLVKIPEYTQAAIAVSKTIREALPVQDVADELKELVMAFAPLGKLMTEAAAKIVTDNVMFKAHLVAKAKQGAGISESAALAIVLNEMDTIERLGEYSRTKDTKDPKAKSP